MEKLETPKVYRQSTILEGNSEMIFHARRGQVSYGEDIGIIMLDSYTPFIQGDVGNAKTFDFPVRYHVVKGLTVEMALGKDTKMVQKIIDAATELAAQGVKAITADCGYLVIHQKEVAQSVEVPVFLSSLFQLHAGRARLRRGHNTGKGIF